MNKTAMQTVTIRISNYDVYENGRAKLSSLMKYMQQLARDDCDSYGATYGALRNDNMVFVITNLAIEFYDDLYDGDIIELSTCNNAIRGVIFERRFIATRNGDLIFSAVTDWVLMDFTARKVLRPSAMRFPIVEEHKMDSPLTTKRRIPSPESGIETEHIVRYTELDENRHLNNTVYADILIDNLATDVPDKRIETCFLNFNGEACLGDSLSVISNYSDGIYRSAATNTKNMKSCYAAELKFYGD